MRIVDEKRKALAAITAVMVARIMVATFGPPRKSEIVPAIKPPIGARAAFRLTTLVILPRKLSGMESWSIV